jgi:hypothetical protein
MPKGIRWLSVGLIISLLYTSVYAADSAPLGAGYFSIKLGQIQLIDDEEYWEFNDIEEDNYVAINWYGYLGRDFYLGLELGYAKFTGEVVGIDTDLTMIPVELNLKYVLDMTRNIQFDFGIGVGLITTYGTVIWPPLIGSIEDFFHTRSVLSAQGFADFNFKLKRFFVGAHAKYQIVEDLIDTINLDNYQVGVHIGLTFD